MGTGKRDAEGMWLETRGTRWPHLIWWLEAYAAAEKIGEETSDGRSVPILGEEWRRDVLPSVWVRVFFLSLEILRTGRIFFF
jgi:hypothetical protein